MRQLAIDIPKLNHAAWILMIGMWISCLLLSESETIWYLCFESIFLFCSMVYVSWDDKMILMFWDFGQRIPVSIWRKHSSRSCMSNIFWYCIGFIFGLINNCLWKAWVLLVSLFVKMFYVDSYCLLSTIFISAALLGRLLVKKCVL